MIMFTKVSAIFLPFLLLILLVCLPPATACPFQVRAFCVCIDGLDGVQLNCTAPAEIGQNSTMTHHRIGQHTQDGPIQMMQLLKNSQTQLGLLKVLTIHGTSIPVLASNFFTGLFIRRLELINCDIAVVEKGAFSGLESVLHELEISGNQIREMPSTALSGFNALLRMDLSNNSIGELTIDHVLPRLPRLTDINLSHNKINGIHKNFFEGIKGTVQTINLGHNLLEDVPASALRGFRSLLALHLHNNLLGSLPALSFMNLPVLSLLNLAANRIGHIHRQAFLNAPMLRYLYLSENRITELLPFQLSSFEQLEMLDLSNNLLESLDNDSFAGLPSLRQIYLGENHINRIDPHAFSQNSSIAVLIMEHNWMTEVQKDTFHALRQLQQLSLKGNKLKSIDAAAFQGNPSLVMLDLSHNELLDLAPATFLSQLNLLLVDLSFNRIVRTPFGAFGRRVATVLLQENPLVCVEQIHMLQQGNGVFIPNNEDVVCGKDKSTSTMGTTEHMKHPNAESAEMPSIVRPMPDENSEGSEQQEEESAFVQQHQSSPLPELSTSSETQSDGRNRMANIRPIRIGPQTTIIQPAGQFGHNDPTLSTSWTTKTALSEITLPTSRPQIDQIERQNDKVAPSAPIPMSEGIAEGESTAKTEQSSVETEATHHTTVDPRNNPAVIYPHPVPFLASGPKLHTAHSVNSDEEGNPILTLPPSIVLAGGDDGEQMLPRPLFGDEEDKNNELADQNNQHSHSLLPNATKTAEEHDQKFEQFELNPKNNNDNDVQLNEQFTDEKIEEANVAGGQSRARSMGKPLPTAVIVICMSTVGVVMSAVFVGMCVARKRQLRHGHTPLGAGSSDLHSLQHSPNSNSYMSAAVAARAAQLNGLIYPHQAANGTLQRGTLQRGGTTRSTSSSGGTLPMNHLHTTQQQQEDIYGWMYTPRGYNAYAK